MGGSKRSTRLTFLALVLTGAIACTDTVAPVGDSEGDTAPSVSLAVAVGSSGAAASLAPSFDLMFNDGANTLEISRVAMVLREVELKLVEDDDCEDSSDGDDDDCEEFEVGPFLLELPLDGEVVHLVTLDGVTPGVYDELEFDIHKPDDDTPEDLAFLAEHPDFRDVSIRVEGTFNAASFTYLTDLNEEQELDLVPPLVIGQETSTTVTLLLDLDSWFRLADGTLIDPATANKGGANENLVRDSIRDSIEGFEDEDEDGSEDD
jgi:hypothetical protein